MLMPENEEIPLNLPFLALFESNLEKLRLSGKAGKAKENTTDFNFSNHLFRKDDQFKLKLEKSKHRFLTAISFSIFYVELDVNKSKKLDP
jgi:hypothetical protein